jgi:hypothetical protein
MRTPSALLLLLVHHKPHHSHACARSTRNSCNKLKALDHIDAGSQIHVDLQQQQQQLALAPSHWFSCSLGTGPLASSSKEHLQGGAGAGPGSQAGKEEGPNSCT